MSITKNVTSRSNLTAWLQLLVRMLAMIAQEVLPAHVGAHLPCNVNDTKALIGLCLLKTSH